MSKTDGIIMTLFGALFLFLGFLSLFIYPGLQNLVQVLVQDPNMASIDPLFGVWAPPFFSVYGFVIAIPCTVFLLSLGARLVVGAVEIFRNAPNEITLGKSLLNTCALVPFGVLILVVGLPGSVYVTVGGFVVSIMSSALLGPLGSWLFGALGLFGMVGTVVVFIGALILGIVSIGLGVGSLNEALSSEKRGGQISGTKSPLAFATISPTDTRCPLCHITITAGDIANRCCPDQNCGAIFELRGT